MLQLCQNCFSGGSNLYDGLPGFALFLVEQAIYTKWGRLSFFMSETANLHCYGLWWTLRKRAK